MFVSLCPELGVASQGMTHKEAYSMLAEAVESWLEAASANEIRAPPENWRERAAGSNSGLK